MIMWVAADAQVGATSIGFHCDVSRLMPSAACFFSDNCRRYGCNWCVSCDVPDSCQYCVLGVGWLERL